MVNEKLRSKISSTVFQSKVIYFEKSEMPSKLVGEHNKENIAAAVTVGKIVGVEEEIIKKAIRNFKGLQYRIEFVKEVFE